MGEVEKDWNGFRVERRGEEKTWRQWKEEMREKLGLGFTNSRVKKKSLPDCRSIGGNREQSRFQSVDRLRAANKFLFQAISVDRDGRPGLMPGQIGRPGRSTGTAETS